MFNKHPKFNLGSIMNKTFKVLQIIIVVFLLSACGRTAPKCSDSETQSLVKSIIKDSIIENFGKGLVNNISFSLSTIRTTDYSEKTGSQECASSLYLTMLSKKEEVEITYKTELIDTGDEFLVTIKDYGVLEATIMKFNLLLLAEQEKRKRMKREEKRMLIIKRKREKEKEKKESSNRLLQERMEISNKLDQQYLSSKTSKLEKGLFNAMKLNTDTNQRLANSGKAIQAYIKSSFLNKKPNERLDYTDYWVLKKNSTFMGHELLIIEEEYMSEYIGCCVSEGLGVTIKIKKDLSDLELFTKIHGCSLTKKVNIEEEMSSLGISVKNTGNYASVSCRHRDISFNE